MNVSYYKHGGVYILNRLTQTDCLVINHLKDLSRTDRMKLLFIFEEIKNTIMHDETMEQMHEVIERIKK